MKWNENAFDQLVLDGGQKRLIHAFAKHKLVENSEFDDFISGKGKLYTHFIYIYNNAYILYRERHSHATLRSAWSWKDLDGRIWYRYE